jgi:hypothetical protein
MLTTWTMPPPDFILRLVERRTDLRVAGEMVVIGPVEHIVRGLVFSQIEPEGEGRLPIDVYAVLHLLCGPCAVRESAQACLSVGRAGTYIGPTDGSPGPIVDWVASEAGEDAVCRVIEEQTIPKLMAIRTLDDLRDYLLRYEQLERWPQDWTSADMFHLELARGDFDAARDILGRHRDEWFQPPSYFFSLAEHVGAERSRLLSHLLETDARPEIYSVLRDLEIIAAFVLGVHGLWKQRCVFPREETHWAPAKPEGDFETYPRAAYER